MKEMESYETSNQTQSIQGLGKANRGSSVSGLKPYRQTLTLANADTSQDGTANTPVDVGEWVVPRSVKYSFTHVRKFKHTIYMVLKDGSGTPVELDGSSEIRIKVMDNMKQRIRADIWRGIYAEIQAGDLADIRKVIVPQVTVYIPQDMRIVVEVNGNLAMAKANSTIYLNCTMWQVG